MTKRRHTLRRRWTPAELDLLRRLYPDTPMRDLQSRFSRPVINQIYAKAHKLGLHRSAAYLASYPARFLLGMRRSPATEFKPGQIAWNKGLHYVPGGRSAETRFKPGHASTHDPEIYIVGVLRIRSDGQLDIKVHEGARSWRCMARWVWEQAHGPIPRGHAVRAINGDRYDTRIENLRLATRADLMRANTRHNLPPALNQVIGLRAALVRKINRRTRHEQDHPRPA